MINMDTGFRSFVSENEIEETKRKRQEEWERVRQPNEPLIAPEPEVDNRSLYDRLKEQRDKKDAEFAEAHKLKNLFRGLDNEEVDYLDQVDNMREAEDRKREDEVRELLTACEKASNEHSLLRSTVAFQQEATLPSKSKDSASVSKPVSKQAKLLAGAIKRRPSSLDQHDEPAKKTTKITPPNTEAEAQQSEKVEPPAPAESAAENNRSSKTNELKSLKVEAPAPAESAAGNSRSSKIVVPVAYRPSAMQKVAVLPGLTGYQKTSASESDDSSSDEDAYTFSLLSQTNANGNSKSRGRSNATGEECSRQN